MPVSIACLHVFRHHFCSNFQLAGPWHFPLHVTVCHHWEKVQSVQKRNSGFN